MMRPGSGFVVVLVFVLLATLGNEGVMRGGVVVEGLAECKTELWGKEKGCLSNKDCNDACVQRFAPFLSAHGYCWRNTICLCRYPC